ncbi:hypothetical protein CS022_18220 [Veronia nyctiphanis]|uniref:Uncharacterized protein n=1 Tax=Veronia nyctiphanis TaxID=1278244 RepID=A0A4Q0YMH8_9GAMM|nr:helix-turn-helix transcriptional regulator [Veronia nyctiphanis]RXJ72015.1 hypothetical protein CS022_17940 [Veronia nyctiphanis]RXJ72062.1 hypothetical protein CS022_18220 [Veronia nyctiphanis]
MTICTKAPQQRIAELVAQAGSQNKAAQLISAEVGYSFQQSTLSKLVRGEGKPSMFYLVAYALHNAVSKQGDERAA